MAATITKLEQHPNFVHKCPRLDLLTQQPIVSFNLKSQQILSLKEEVLRRGHVSKLKCCKGSLMSELNMEEEWIGIKKLNGKCNQSVGMVELMECLEKEAIMGEDQGKEPTDYNRMAQIFYKSSKVFQALKETTTKSEDY